jgi:EpsI family protein
MVIDRPFTEDLSKGLAAMVLMVASALAANAYIPTERLADVKPKILLEQQIPKKFGDWVEDTTMLPILPNPEVQEKLDVLYSSTLARTYRNSAGERIMLSIAYGSDQGSEATAVHRPEFCYSAQGFKVSDLGDATVAIGSKQLEVRRLLGVVGNRNEPITYWITLDETATLPGFSRKYEQVRYGLRGQIPDGLLFRVSSINTDSAASFRLQERFLSDLAGSMNPEILSRYFGK